MTDTTTIRRAMLDASDGDIEQIVDGIRTRLDATGPIDPLLEDIASLLGLDTECE
jgi:hypothetical protein